MAVDIAREWPHGTSQAVGGLDSILVQIRTYPRDVLHWSAPEGRTRAMTRIPTSALLLGLSGLIPFLWGAATHLSPELALWSTTTLGQRFTGSFLLQGYGIVILAFMSGVIWGFATRATGAVAATGYAFSVLPALWAFFMGTGAPGPALIALGAGFIALLMLDRMFQSQGLAPEWWMALRLLLTTIVVLCLAVGAFL